jgi:hypothetical protein
MDVGTSTPVWVAAITPLLALAGAAFGSAVLFWNNSRNVKVENITKERAKWRDKVRDRSLNVHKATNTGNEAWLSELHLEFSLILNPLDDEDRTILNLIRQLKGGPDEVHLTEFADRVSLLLKHDWDRAKWEAKGGDTPFACDADLLAEPPRTKYTDFKRKQMTKTTRSY